MNLDRYAPCRIIDCHIHYRHPSQMEPLVRVCDALDIERLNIVCTPDRARLSLVPDALHLKAHYPQRVFVFGGLDISAYFRAPEQVGALFAESLDFLAAAGCDGIKMIEGKPDMRKMLPIPPFDSPVFAPYWQRLAQMQMPLLFHVNDPEEFWDPARIPDWAAERGWFYGDGTFIDNERQYSEIFNVLAQYPELKVIFAHFFFLSAQLDRLAGLFDRFPNVCVDLTPGIEMYRNFSINIEKTREFFLRYPDRVLFGTDIGAKALLSVPQTDIQRAESSERVTVIRNFLENPGEFRLRPDTGFLFGAPGVSFRGLGLPLPVLEKIYSLNFERIVSPAPRPVDGRMVIAMCAQIEQALASQGAGPAGVVADSSVARRVRSFFESRL